MANVFVELTVIDDVKPHPNADKLEIAIIKGTQTISGRVNFIRASGSCFSRQVF